MKNTWGTSVSVTLFGESHGAAIGAVVDGITPGIQIDDDFINQQLTLRRPAPARNLFGKKVSGLPKTFGNLFGWIFYIYLLTERAAIVSVGPCPLGLVQSYIFTFFWGRGPNRSLKSARNSR